MPIDENNALVRLCFVCPVLLHHKRCYKYQTPLKALTHNGRIGKTKTKTDVEDVGCLGIRPFEDKYLASGKL